MQGQSVHSVHRVQGAWCRVLALHRVQGLRGVMVWQGWQEGTCTVVHARMEALASALLRMPQVGWLVSALRKLAAANTAEENSRTLYRCMRGAITGRRASAHHWQSGRSLVAHVCACTAVGSFWLPDAQNIVCAVDTAFMSTALEPVPHYMDEPGKPSVLLELRASAQDDTGYHCGAEVAPHCPAYPTHLALFVDACPGEAARGRYTKRGRSAGRWLCCPANSTQTCSLGWNPTERLSRHNSGRLPLSICGRARGDALVMSRPPHLLHRLCAHGHHNVFGMNGVFHAGHLPAPHDAPRGNA